MIQTPNHSPRKTFGRSDHSIELIARASSETKKNPPVSSGGFFGALLITSGDHDDANRHSDDDRHNRTGLRARHRHKTVVVLFGNSVHIHRKPIGLARCCRCSKTIQPALRMRR